MIRERRTGTPNGGLAWLEAGAGWPVVLLHAFPLNADMWRPQLERVPDGWRFLAPDFRGFGGSRTDGPPEDGSQGIDRYAADVLAFMDALTIESAMIAGLSMGGYVALAMHRQAPLRFAGLVLADTRATADTVEGRAGRVRMRELLAREGPAAVADQMLPKLLSAGADAALVAHVRDLITRAEPAGVDAAIAAMMSRPDSTPYLPQIGCATLIVAGDRDEITPVADADAMQRAIPLSMLTVIPGAGHLSNLEQPELFSRGLADFLRAH